MAVVLFCYTFFTLNSINIRILHRPQLNCPRAKQSVEDGAERVDTCRYGEHCSPRRDRLLHSRSTHFVDVK